MFNPMNSFSRKRSKHVKEGTRQRRLRFEQFEDRCMLSISADIVFIVDESGTELNTHSQEWLANLVIGVDANSDGDRTDLGDTLSFAEQLDAAGVDDIRYGLVGFGEAINAGDPDKSTDDIVRFAHTQLMVPGDSTSLFLNPAGPDGNLGTADDVSTGTFNTLFSTNLEQQGADTTEDGWDSLEHVIAEYDFRIGAVPMIVLVQGDQGRLGINNTLTHSGLLSALHSKNVVLNSVIAGQLLVNGSVPTQNPSEPLSQPPGADFEWAPIFNLSPYEDPNTNWFDEVYLLGVEADSVNGVQDGRHDYHWVDTDPTTVSGPTHTFSDSLQISFDGSNTGATGMVGTGFFIAA